MEFHIIFSICIKSCALVDDEASWQNDFSPKSKHVLFGEIQTSQPINKK
jgi:hypothetical protein